MAQTVLVIDDSVDAHELVEFLLAGEGFEIRQAMSGDEGLAAAVREPPDLILLDVDMPAPNGFDVCRALKGHAATQAVPIVFLTGASATAEKIRGLDMGAIDYVTKPFDPAELRARVLSALRTKFMMDLLSQRAMIDGLTGLWNRSYFDHRLRTEAMVAERTGEPLACVMLDVDHFKAVNDAHGHPGGDHVLRAIAAAVTRAARKQDVVARAGGEEFAVLMPGVSVTGAAMLAERLRGEVENSPVTYREAVVNVTCSFGVADISGPTRVANSGGEAGSGTCQALVERADTALYRAKRGGRNRVMIDDAGEWNPGAAA